MLRGRKRDVWEGGHRVPGLLSYPRLVGARSLESWVTVSTMDLLPTPPIDRETRMLVRDLVRDSVVKPWWMLHDLFPMLNEAIVGLVQPDGLRGLSVSAEIRHVALHLLGEPADAALSLLGQTIPLASVRLPPLSASLRLAICSIIASDALPSSPTLCCTSAKMSASEMRRSADDHACSAWLC